MKSRICAALAIPALFATTQVAAASPQPGAAIPTFAATSMAGKPVRWADVSGPNGAVLVFVRSAKWCPFCQKQLLDLQAAAAPLAERGYHLAAISYDKPEELARFAKARQVDYMLLADKGSAMIDAFGLRDPQYPPGHYAHGVPQPTIFVISREGKVQARMAEEGYKNRPPVQTVIAAVEEVN